jgi:hypothetical protein
MRHGRQLLRRDSVSCSGVRFVGLGVPIVEEMVVVLAYGTDQIDVSHPFNHTTSHISRDNHSDGESVIRSKEFAVVHVRNNDILSPIQLQNRLNSNRIRAVGLR